MTHRAVLDRPAEAEGATTPPAGPSGPGGPVPPRILGTIRGGGPGPTLVCVGGLHGNEPAGVRALERVLERLASRAGAMRGDLVALTGNRSALALSRRFVDRDLNRAWTDERIAALRAGGTAGGQVEDREQVELLAAVEDVVTAARGPVYFLDLHTTSGSGGPFITFGDTLPNRAFAAHIPVPMILGLEELVDGTLLAFLSRHGIVGAVYETGQHAEPRAVDRAEAGVWLAAAAVGLLPESLLPETAAARKLLARDTGHLPTAMEMVYRHHVETLDGFVMDPGYENFQPVRKGQAVARDVHGPVTVPHEGRLLMPLYQQQGQDGFFLIRDFSPFWLRASHILRTLGVERLVHLLPGIGHDPARPDAVVVDTRVARWLAVPFFHLLGYRKHEEEGPRLIMRRRRYDDARYVVRAPRPEALTQPGVATPSTAR